MILFTAGWFCGVCSVLLALYLLSRDASTDKPGGPRRMREGDRVMSADWTREQLIAQRDRH